MVQNKPKLLSAETLTEDILFDACLNNEYMAALVKHGNASKTSLIREMMAQQSKTKYVYLEANEGKARATFRVVPLGYVKNLTQAYGAKLNRGYGTNLIFGKWKENHPEEKAATVSSNKFQNVLKAMGFYSADYLIMMIKYEN